MGNYCQRWIKQCWLRAYYGIRASRQLTCCCGVKLRGVQNTDIKSCTSASACAPRHAEKCSCYSITRIAHACNAVSQNVELHMHACRGALVYPSAPAPGWWAL